MIFFKDVDGVHHPLSEILSFRWDKTTKEYGVVLKPTDGVLVNAETVYVKRDALLRALRSADAGVNRENITEVTKEERVLFTDMFLNMELILKCLRVTDNNELAEKFDDQYRYIVDCGGLDFWESVAED